MSTRSTTHFTHNADTVAIIYRHMDGYPEGAGVDLLQFLNRCKGLSDSRLTDPSYLAAKYVVFLAEMFCRTEDRLDFLSVGVVAEDPCDIEYRYVVNCGAIGRDGLPKVTCLKVDGPWSERFKGRNAQYKPVPIPGYDGGAQ